MCYIKYIIISKHLPLNFYRPYILTQLLKALTIERLQQSTMIDQEAAMVPYPIDDWSQDFKW